MVKVLLYKIEIRISSGSLIVNNAYAAPNWDRSDPKWLDLIINNTIMLRDINAKGPWDPQAVTSNKPGEHLEEKRQAVSLTVLNNGKPTRTSSAPQGTNSVIDIIAVYPRWVAQTDVSVDDLPTSDNHVIITTINTGRSVSASRRKRWAFSKANWDKFQTTLDDLLRKIPEGIVQIEEQNKRLAKGIRKAAKQAITIGRRSKEVAWWNEEVAKAAQERKKHGKNTKRRTRRAPPSP